jgi:hypothetical protein
MCLKVNGKPKFKKVGKDIKCYKVIRDHGNNIYSAPYHMMLVTLGKEYKTGAEKMDFTYSKEKNQTIVRGDAFHSFLKKEDAAALATELSKTIRYDDNFTYKVVECSLGKENNAIRGLFKEYESICSDTIKYERII